LERAGGLMYRFCKLEMNGTRQTEIVDEELPDDKEDFFYSEDNYDDEDYDDEPQEREYCD